MFEVLLVILPLFLIIFGSAFLVRIGIADEKWQPVLNSYAVKIGLPALIFSALSKLEFNWADQITLIVANSLLILSVFAAVFVAGKVFRIGKKMFRTLFFSLGFGNLAYLGFPVLVQLEGEQILARASLIVAVYLFWFFTIGIGFLEFTKGNRSKFVLNTVLVKLLKNPLLIAVYVGLIFAFFKIQLPDVVNQSIGMVASSVTPVVLVVIGLFLGTAKFGRLKDWFPVGVFTLITLMALPAMMYYGLKYFGYIPSNFTASIIEAAMPIAITPFAISGEYDLDDAFIARTIVLSTIVSVITIPFWTTLL